MRNRQLSQTLPLSAGLKSVTVTEQQHHHAVNVTSASVTAANVYANASVTHHPQQLYGGALYATQVNSTNASIMGATMTNPYPSSATLTQYQPIMNSYQWTDIQQTSSSVAYGASATGNALYTAAPVTTAHTAPTTQHQQTTAKPAVTTTAACRLRPARGPLLRARATRRVRSPPIASPGLMQRHLNKYQRRYHLATRSTTNHHLQHTSMESIQRGRSGRSGRSVGRGQAPAHTPDINNAIYKPHVAINKLNSYEKAGFHSGTPPPFGAASHLYIPAPPHHHPHHHPPQHQMDVRVNSSHRRESGSGTRTGGKSAGANKPAGYPQSQGSRHTSHVQG
ncbi:unnamed protein product [Leptidea sinapis]|uniref:Uncharacterized protein n=1 Tax=Leptidea sinapis TaxID=189913 RepID=A0A5E4QBY4_9NEOP|nr:unnamed protein product [Leptidea sinapis]